MKGTKLNNKSEGEMNEVKPDHTTKFPDTYLVTPYVSR